MGARPKISINYVTASPFKKEETEAFLRSAALADGTPVRDRFEFRFRAIPVTEMLVVDIAVMVQAEAVEAYCQMRSPCIVEHAGLIFDDYKDQSYPGGLTKPMWNTLGDRFIEETNSDGRRATARAVVAYCDGMATRTFVGETNGCIANEPRGARAFYWDTVFIPDDLERPGSDLTYAQIVEDSSLGLGYKMEHLSQSAKAMRKFLEYLDSTPQPELWK